MSQRLSVKAREMSLNTIWSFLKKAGVVVGALSVPLAFCELIGHPATVVGSSMEPTLHGSNGQWWNNDIVWVSRIFTKPRNGDLFTFISPRDPKVVHIKRVNKSPGDIVRAPNGDVITLSQYQYWMLSDNSSVGQDSRTYGPVNYGLFKAKLVYVLWPPNRFGPVN